LIVVALWAWLFPELRNADKLTPVQEQPSASISRVQNAIPGDTELGD
jgi:hypothetical protein